MSAFTTDFEFQLLSAVADGFTFTIQNEGVSAIGPGGSGLGYGASSPAVPAASRRALPSSSIFIATLERVRTRPGFIAMAPRRRFRLAI